MLLARASLALGDLDQAEAEIAPLVDRFTEMGTRLTAFEATLVRAEIATSAGEPARALALLDEGEAAAKGEVAPLRARLCLQRAAALLALGDLDGCSSLVDEGLATAREQDLPYEEAAAARPGGLAVVAIARGDARAQPPTWPQTQIGSSHAWRRPRSRSSGAGLTTRG